MLDRGYFEALSLRDLRGLLDGASLVLRRGAWVVAVDLTGSAHHRAVDDSLPTSVLGAGPTVIDALLDGLEQASAAGWFDGEEKRS